MLTKGVIKILTDMHAFCTHRDLKQSHIRICLDPEDCKNLVFGTRTCNDMVIRNISIIDVETAKMNEDLTENEVDASVTNDIKQLIVSLTGYLTTLEHPTETLKKLLPMSGDLRLERFEKFLDTIRDKYTIPQPGLVITHSNTMDFLMEYLDEKN